jgi:hypothetical protein
MKKTLLFLLAGITLIGATACSSNARIGTQHHHVSVGGSAQ